MLFFPTADEDFQYFRSQGYTGSINDMHYKAMGDLGYTGSLNDRIHAYLVNTYGNFYEAMRGLRNGTLTFSLSSYIVNGFDPDLVFDFEKNYYRTGGTDSTLSSSITHTRASSATMVNSSGNIVTVGNNVARTGHHIYNGSAWVNEGILHESEARTNIVKYSEDFTVGGLNWLLTNVTVTASSVVSPDGETNAYELDMNSGGFMRTLTGHVPSVGDTYTASIWLKAGTLSTVGLSLLFSGSGLGEITETLTLTNEWQRFHIASTVPSGTPDQVRMRVKTLTQTGSILAFGAQIEAGSTPSSYIPTSGSQVTRAAETLSVPAANLPYSSTNMSIQMDGKMTGNNLTHIRWFEDADDAILLETGTNNFTFTQEAGGTVDTVTGGSFTSGNLLAFNTASRHGSGFINGAISGTALTANTTPSALPDLADNNLVLGYDYMGTIGKFRMWDEDLTDTGIAEAST